MHFFSFQLLLSYFIARCQVFIRLLIILYMLDRLVSSLFEGLEISQKNIQSCQVTQHFCMFSIFLALLLIQTYFSHEPFLRRFCYKKKKKKWHCNHFELNFIPEFTAGLTLEQSCAQHFLSQIWIFFRFRLGFLEMGNYIILCFYYSCSSMLFDFVKR